MDDLSVTRRLTQILLLCAACGCAHAEAPAPHAAPTRPGAQALARARAALVAGDTLRSEQYALLALRSGAAEADVVMPLIQACLASSRVRAALSYAEPYLRKHPDAVHLRYLVAALHLALGHARRARSELERVVSRRPDLADAYYLDGLIARDAFGDADSARERFQRYLALAPDGTHAPELSAWLAEQP